MCSLFVEHGGDHTIVTVAGVVDLGSAARFAEALDLLDGPLVVDFSARLGDASRRVSVRCRSGRDPGSGPNAGDRDSRRNGVG